MGATRITPVIARHTLGRVLPEILRLQLGAMTEPSIPSVPAVAPKRVAAFFDLDKTIIATSSAYAFGKEFLHSGLITPQEALQISLAKATYMMFGHSEDQMDSSKEQLSQMVKGWSVDEVKNIVADTLHTVVTPVIYAEARELIDAHRAAGHAVIIISASATTLVEPIAAELGVDQVVASQPEIKDGKFTGEFITYVKGPAKAAAVQAFVAQHGIDLRNSYAYSDSATDIPMLEMVGNPVAVNADRALKLYAQEHGWQTYTFKNPVPLFPLPSAKDLTVGLGVAAGVAAAVAAGLWLGTGKDSKKA